MKSYLLFCTQKWYKNIEGIIHDWIRVFTDVAGMSCLYGQGLILKCHTSWVPKSLIGQTPSGGEALWTALVSAFCFSWTGPTLVIFPALSEKNESVMGTHFSLCSSHLAQN